MHPLACLALVVAAAPAIDIPLGAGAVPVEVALEVRTAARASVAPILAWRTLGDGTLEASARLPEALATVRLVPAERGARTVEVSLRWLSPASLERAALVLSWRGAPRAVGRDLAFAPLAGPHRTGRGTPILVAGGPLVLAGGPGFLGARAEPVAGGVRVALLLDDADERPFSTYDTCRDKLPDGSEHQHLRWAELEVRHAVRGVSRAPGDEDLARATLYPVAAASMLRPVVVERWPAGARAAIVLTDHADRTDPDALRAVLWGSSDPRADGGVGAGLLGRGLRITRTFFVHARRGALDDPEIRLLADDLAGAGSEVALHSVTPERDDRDAVREGLAAVAPWRPSTWIDHEPYTNCEAVSSRGAGTEGPFGVSDLLAAGGLRWIWAAGDVDGRAGTRIVNLFGGDPAEARPAIFPLPQDPRLWVFRSSMFHAAPAELAEALSDAALERLERERGLFVAHTYFGPSARTTHSADQLARLVVVEGKGALAIHPALDAALARLAARVRAGRLVSLAWAQAGDRLRALADVEVTYRADGAAEIHNRGAEAIAALTVALPAAGLDVALEGAALLGREDEGGLARLWFDLGPGEKATLRAWDGFEAVPLLPDR
ncbi:MAG TPA: hypothetical protein VF912_07270 [Anaeromyxobacter sp.]